MINKFAFALILALPVCAHSKTVCTGKVTKVMDWPSRCGGEMAYMTDNANGHWFCTISEKSGAIVLAALASGKNVRTVISSIDQDCDKITTHYLKPEYLYILD